MLNDNFVKKKLNNNEICLGIWSIINSNSNLDIFSKCKIDFILLDMEHGNYFDNIENSIRTIENNNVSPIIRIPNYNSHYIQSNLDFGIHGIIAPQLKSIEQINEYLELTLFPPKGIRGFNPFVRSSSYNINNKVNLNVDKFILRSIILEDTKLLDQIEEICKIEFLDLIYIGAYDLSKSLNIDPNGSEMKKIIKDTTKIIKSFNKDVGAIVFNEKDFKELTDYGVNFIVYSVDSKIISSDLESFLHKI